MSNKIQHSASQDAPEMCGDLFSDEKGTYSRILCRDEQFDEGRIPLIKLLMKALIVGFAPIFLAIYIYA